MAQATKHGGNPASTKERTKSIRDFEEFKPGDVVEHVSVYRNGVDVRREEEIPAVPTTYTLELSEDEAMTLQDIMRAIGGPASSRRRHATAVSDALHGAGAVWQGDSDMNKDKRAIYFE